MEDSFRVRVDKTFGTLGTDAPSSVGVNPSLWSLTDEEIERREWIRNKGEDVVESEPSIGGNQLDSDLRDLSDVEEEGEDGEQEEDEQEDEAIDFRSKKRQRNNNTGDEATSVEEYLDVRSNIGRDCTLDYEEEEDQYDKVAVGTEQIGDRIYMKDVKFADYGIHENEYGQLPNTFRAAIKDPRANHDAAKLRLKEDAEAAGDLDSLQLSDKSAVMNVKTEDVKTGGLDGDNPKPILKKRENQIDSRSQKRVRFAFDPASSIQAHENRQLSVASDLVSEPRASDDGEMPKQAYDLSQPSGVPDYLINPSKYTHYTFDSSDDMNDQSNRTAFMDFFNSLRKGNTDPSLDDTSAEIPKSIVFTPRKKPEHDSMAKRSESEHSRDNLKNKSWPVAIAAEDTQESEVSAMEEDEPSPPVEMVSFRKPGRKYRTRTVNDDDNCDIDDTVN